MHLHFVWLSLSPDLKTQNDTLVPIESTDLTDRTMVGRLRGRKRRVHLKRSDDDQRVPVRSCQNVFSARAGSR